MAGAAELQSAVDALKASVAKVVADVTALKAASAAAVPQAQVDAVIADVTKATSDLDALSKA